MGIIAAYQFLQILKEMFCWILYSETATQIKAGNPEDYFWLQTALLFTTTLTARATPIASYLRQFQFQASASALLYRSPLGRNFDYTHNHFVLGSITGSRGCNWMTISSHVGLSDDSDDCLAPFLDHWALMGYFKEGLSQSLL